jgi:hypothetical protein
LPWLPGKLESELHWICLTGVVTEHLLPIDRLQLQTLNNLGVPVNEGDNLSSQSISKTPQEASIYSPNDTRTNSPLYVVKVSVFVWLLGTAAVLLYYLVGYLRTIALIGFMGDTGQATSSHLHFSIIKDGKYIDPVLLIDSVLYPIMALT